ncbi:MAG: hypothetical protein NXI25_08850 [bacterium]|nr:hypothetical protein [bacterium]
MKDILILFSSLLWITGALLAYSGCTSDQLPEPMVAATCTDTIPAYDPQVRQIIEESCAYSGCHLDGTAPGVYDSYQGVLPNIESGAFRTRVLELKDDPNQGMPPDYAPEGRPKDLTPEQLDLLECWLDSGHPE